jgi:hypothetical protein
MTVEDASARMERGEGAIRGGVRRSVRGQSLINGSEHKTSDSLHDPFAQARLGPHVAENRSNFRAANYRASGELLLVPIECFLEHTTIRCDGNVVMNMARCELSTANTEFLMRITAQFG